MVKARNVVATSDGGQKRGGFQRCLMGQRTELGDQIWGMREKGGLGKCPYFWLRSQWGHV